MRIRLSIAVLSAAALAAGAAQATKSDFFARLKGPSKTVASAPASAPASTPAASAPAEAPKPPPPYAVVEGAHPESSDQTQTVTLLCPKPLRSFGVGYTALIKNPPPAKGAAAGPAWHEETLADIRTLPDANGTGWQVTGTALPRKDGALTWRLVVRVVCAKAPV